MLAGFVESPPWNDATSGKGTAVVLELLSPKCSLLLDRAALDRYAGAVGLDAGRFSNALDHHTHKGAIDTDAAGAREAGVSGTPAFSIDGYYLYGVPKYVSLRKLVERALADVRAQGN